MKRIFYLCVCAFFAMGIAGCIDDDFDDIQGEWRLIGWEKDSVFHNVDQSLVGFHSLSIEFSGKKVTAYSLINSTSFGKMKSKDGFIFKDELVQTQVYADNDDSNFFDKYITAIYRLEKSNTKLKIYFAENDYFLFTNEYAGKE